MKLIPFFDRIIVEAKAAEEKKGRIIIPEQAKEKPILGTVLAIGPGKVDAHGNLIPVPVAVGDTVVFGKYAGTKVLLNDKELLMFLSDDLFCRVGEEEGDSEELEGAETPVYTT